MNDGIHVSPKSLLRLKVIDQWHTYLGDRTVADAILDRLVHNSYRLVLKGESMRKRRGSAAVAASPKAKQR